MNKIYLAIIGIVAVLGMGVMFLGAEDSDAAVVASGTCGTDLNWEYDDETTTLTISGSGTTMSDYGGSGGPWYRNYSTMTKVVFECPNLENIGKYAFGINSGSTLNNVIEFTIPDTVKTIGDNAFKRAYNTYFSYSPNIEYIGGSAFENTKFDWQELPNSLTYIGASAFGYCTQLSTIDIPENVTFLGVQVFRGCTNLQHVGYYATNVTNDYSSGNPFTICANIQEIIIGENVQSIPAHLFDYGPSGTIFPPLTIEWNIPHSNDLVVDNGIFAYRNTTTLNFGDNVEYIPAYLTDSIKTTLTTVNMSDSITVIGENAFTGVTDIDNKLILPELVVGYYTDNTFTTKADLYAGQVGYGAVIQSADVDPNYQDETINLDNVIATMNVSGTDYDLVPEYAIYPTDYTTGTDSGMAGKLLKTIPVFVALALLMGIVVAVRSRMD